MSEPTDYERGLRDGVEIARHFEMRHFFICVALMLLGALLGAVLTP